VIRNDPGTLQFLLRAAVFDGIFQTEEPSAAVDEYADLTAVVFGDVGICVR
jgi:hypothetical protein